MKFASSAVGIGNGGCHDDQDFTPVFGAGILATVAGTSRGSFAQGTPKRGGTLVATWGGGEPQACYVPAGGGSSPTFSSSKLFERLAKRNMDGTFEGVLAESWKGGRLQVLRGEDPQGREVP